MKYLQKITLCLAAIVVVVLGNKATAMTLDPSDEDQVDSTNYTGQSLTVNDAGYDGGSIILTNPADATLDIEIGGVVKVGSSGGKTGTGATTVESGAILEIAAATAACIGGATEVMSGGIIHVDAGVEVPATSPLYLFLANSIYEMHSRSAVSIGGLGYNNPSPAIHLLCDYVKSLPSGCSINTSTAVVTPPVG